MAAAKKKPAPKKQKIAAKKRPAAKQPAPKKPAAKRAPAAKKKAAKKKATPAARFKQKLAEARTKLRATLADQKKRADEHEAKQSTASLTWSTRAELASQWNAAGRAYNARYSAQIAQLYEGHEVELDAVETRTRADGDAVVTEILAMIEQGQGDRVRDTFDPAYGPLMGWIETHTAQLSFVAIMGEDDLLVRQGSPWHEDGVTYHLHGTTATPLPGITGFYRSRNREHLVVAREDGLHFYDAREGVAALRRDALATLPWPPLSILEPAGLSDVQKADRADARADRRLLVESLQMSDDGMRVVMTAYRQGILLASRVPGEPAWQLLWPSVAPPIGNPASTYVRAGDMTHAAISRDGTRLAFGSQDSQHITATIGEAGRVAWYATIGPISEYPHYAMFSDSGNQVFFNSCHFYNGATIMFRWEGNAGVTLDGYVVHEQAPLIENDLRLYAAQFLPPEVSAAILDRPTESSVVALAGSGILRFFIGGVGVAAVQGFGASACAMDYDPALRRLALASYSGYVHVYDPFQAEDPSRIDGWRARKELVRWALWPRLPNGPIRW